MEHFYDKYGDPIAASVFEISCGKYTYTSICISHRHNIPLMRSDMDHTVLRANYTMPAFTPQPQSITTLWLVLILQSHGG